MYSQCLPLKWKAIINKKANQKPEGKRHKSQSTEIFIKAAPSWVWGPLKGPGEGKGRCSKERDKGLEAGQVDREQEW